MPELDILPADAANACLVGRVWRPELEGPSIVTIRDGAVFDICDAVSTMRDLCEAEDPAGLVASIEGCFIGTLEEIAARSNETKRDPSGPWLLAPIDLQAVKALGVTFLASLMERVIEEKAGGDPVKAAAIRVDIETLVGKDLSHLQPGSCEAALLKERLLERGMWSQYLEVGIGPDPEVFTKAQPLSCVGYGADIGVLSSSSWNNPEPEVALAVNSRDPSALVDQVIGPSHQYPDGLLLLLGTMFAPTEDRDDPGMGFTHKPGDRVKISAEKLGCLSNIVRYCHECTPWTISTAYLMRNLSVRGLI